MAKPKKPTTDDSIEILEALANEEGVDVATLLEDFSQAEEEMNEAVLEDAVLPGDEQLRINLSDDSRALFGAELCDILDEHDGAMTPWWTIEDEIRDYYALKVDSSRGSSSGEALCSEFLMNQVDQSYSRIASNMLNAKPLIRCDPIESSFLPFVQAKEFADEAQKFVNPYFMNEMRGRHLLPRALMRATKTGTAVLRFQWRTEKRIRKFYSSETGEVRRVEKEVGHLEQELIENRDVKIWPLSLADWREAQIVGHESRLTPWEYRTLAATYGIDDAYEDLTSMDGEEDLPEDGEVKRMSGSPASVRTAKSLAPRRIVELWCHMTLPGEAEAKRFQVILDRDRKKILWIGENSLHYQTHPYRPIRYKWADSFAWGVGIGHEVLQATVADSSMWTLELDNLFAGAYYIIKRKSGSGFNTQTQDVKPGMEVFVDEMEDFMPIKLGGEAPEIHTSRENNRYRGREASGQSAVMSGQGDPTMKSGAGTGSTLALIEQGNIKMRMLDYNIRTDFTDLCMLVLEMVAQYAPEGVLYRYMSDEQGGGLRMIRYMPPRGELDQFFAINVEAPSAASSEEARRQNYFMFWNFANQAVMAIQQFAAGYLQAENPAGMSRYNYDVANYLTELMRRVSEHHEVPGLTEITPFVPEPTPQDEQINQLTQQLSQLQQQLAAAQQAQQALPPAEGMEGMGGMEMMAPQAPEMGGMGQMDPSMMEMGPDDPANPISRIVAGLASQLPGGA